MRNLTFLKNGKNAQNCVDHFSANWHLNRLKLQNKPCWCVFLSLNCLPIAISIRIVNRYGIYEIWVHLMQVGLKKQNEGPGHKIGLDPLSSYWAQGIGDLTPAHSGRFGSNF